MESDLALYLECIDRPVNKSSLRETLQAVASLINTNSKLKDVFRERQGLHSLLKLLADATLQQDNVLSAVAMYTLSCSIDSCVSSQNVVLQKGTMAFVHRVLKKGSYSSPLFQPATMLLSYLSQGNSLGQNKTRHAGIIPVLLACLRECYPVKKENMYVWNSILTCLSSIVNNPRNTLNQDTCLEILPLCLSALRDNTQDTGLVRSIASFMRLALSDNDTNQLKFAMIGGLTTCVDMLCDATITSRDVVARGTSRDVVARGTSSSARDTAAALISLINAAPKGLVECSALQVRCVPLLLYWIKCGDALDIPPALHTLTLVIENNINAKAALIADRNGMSSVIKCVSVMDESAKKTARLLLQQLFYTDTDTSTDVDSDLESASYELVKEASRKRTHRRIRDAQDTTPQKRSVLKSRSGTQYRPAKRVKPTEETRSLAPTPTFPSQLLTPQPSPRVRTPNKTPFSETSPLVGRSSEDSRGVVDMVGRSSEDSRGVVDMVGRIVEDKMKGFLDQFEYVLSTNASRASSCDVETVAAASEPRSALHSGGSTVKEKKTNDALVQTCNSIEDIKLVDVTTRDKTMTTRDNIMTTRDKGPEEDKTPPNLPETNMLDSENADCEDAVSIVTHVSQESLLHNFFIINPKLLPNSRSLETQSVARNFLKTRPSEKADTGFDNLSATPQATIYGHHLDDTLPTLKAGFTEQEIANLCKGVETFGRAWTAILLRFQFLPHRTTGDLRRKFGQIKKLLSERENKTERKEWSSKRKEWSSRGGAVD